MPPTCGMVRSTAGTPADASEAAAWGHAGVPSQALVAATPAKPCFNSTNNARFSHLNDEPVARVATGADALVQ